MSEICTSPPGAPLQKVVRINAGVRAVIGMSRQINLAAINAALVAKRAGAQARGFGVVSAELRRFSGQLETQMGELDQLIARLVASLAEVAKERRRQGHLQAARQGSADHGGLAATLVRIQVQLELADLSNQQCWGELAGRLRRTLRTCGIGTALARSAKVEAVYGGSFASALRQVAEDIEASIGAIQTALKQLTQDVEQAIA